LAKAFSDLRTWLSHLEDTKQLVRFDQPADLRYDIPRILEEHDGRNAVVFTNLGLPTSPADKVVGGTVTSRAQLAQALGVASGGVLRAYIEALAKPIPALEVPQSQAPVLDASPQDVRVDYLPAPHHHQGDSGRYLTAAVVIAKDQQGNYNWSIHRFQINDARHLGVLILPRHLWRIFSQAEAENRDLPVALVIGLPPACLLASQAITSFGVDESQIAGALLGEPLRVVSSPRYGIRVPACAEFLLEGVLLANVRGPEGPFGEFPRTYGTLNQRPVMRVDAVYHRREPYFQTILPASREHMLLGAVSREATILRTLNQISPNVRDVVMTFSGGGRYHAVVAMSAKQPGEARNVILAALGTVTELKRVVVVDEDVDIHSAEDVEWAIATRLQPQRDIIVVPEVLGSPLDPSADEQGRTGKWGLDATIPVGADRSRFERVRVPVRPNSGRRPENTRALK
jgi:2,5-furandicarboxylate decarboxylase 1